MIPRIPASFWRFGLVGVGGLFVDMAVLYAVIWGLGLGPMPAKVVSFLAAATFTWWMNRRYTFGSSGKSLVHEWASFLATNALGGVVNFAVYTAIVVQPLPLAWAPAMATAMGSLGGLAFNYLGSRYVVCSGRHQRETAHRLPGAGRIRGRFARASEYFHQLSLFHAMKFNPVPWLLILAVLSLSWWARSHFIERQELAFFCEGGAQTLECKTRWLIVKIFYGNGTGYFILFLGLMAAATRSGLVGLAVGVAGVAGLLLHGGDHANVDYAAVGFLLGVLTLARAQFDDYRAQHGTGQHQA